MTTIDDIQTLQKQGKGESEIRTTLMQRGNTAQQVNDAFSQLQIKGAVGGAPGDSSSAFAGSVRDEPVLLSSPSMGVTPGYSSPVLSETPQQSGGAIPAPSAFEGMQPSMFIQESSLDPSQGSAPGMSVPPLPSAGNPKAAGGMNPQQSLPSISGSMGPMPTNDYGGYQDYGQTEQQYGGEYAGDYQPYQEAISSDIVTEVAEQVVSERLAGLQERLEKAIDFRTTADARLTALEDRLVRIEQIMDRLQMSLLQRMGEYVQDVRDVKQELQETQKTFKALVPGLKNVLPSVPAQVQERKSVPQNSPRTRSGMGLP